MTNKISSVRSPKGQLVGFLKPSPPKCHNDRWVISVEYPQGHPLTCTFFGTEKQASAKMMRLSRQLRNTPALDIGLYEMDEWFACNDIKHVLD